MKKTTPFQGNKRGRGIMAPKAPVSRTRRIMQGLSSQETEGNDMAEGGIVRILIAQVKNLVMALQEQGHIFKEQRGQMEEQKDQFEEQR
jgi:hypothetical protein